MKLKLNNEILELPSDVFTLKQLIEWRDIPAQGTAIALNGRLIERTKWDITQLHDNDDIVIITAAFGG